MHVVKTIGPRQRRTNTAKVRLTRPLIATTPMCKPQLDCSNKKQRVSPPPRFATSEYGASRIASHGQCAHWRPWPPQPLTAWDVDKLRAKTTRREGHASADFRRTQRSFLKKAVQRTPEPCGLDWWSSKSHSSIGGQNQIQIQTNGVPEKASSVPPRGTHPAQRPTTSNQTELSLQGTVR